MLVDHRLVRQEETQGEPRFRMLETIREFAWEELERIGDAAEVRTRQAAWFRDLAAVVQPAPVGPEQEEWFDRLNAEHDNLRAALDWGMAPTACRTGPTPLTTPPRVAADESGEGVGFG
ncbi:MAG TPA: hypothetical protein VKB09_07540 [Thermomicrobiales bacterium]|nr:hypothetical protein [Thermomicrobiales bacterium]